MKHCREKLVFNTSQKREFLNITHQVEEVVKKSGINNGLCLVSTMHITSSICITDDETGLHRDFDDLLEKLAPHEPLSNYRHNRDGTINADACLKRQFLGREITLSITDSQIDFGPWEQIFYVELDGQRPKRVLVKVIGE